MSMEKNKNSISRRLSKRAQLINNRHLAKIYTANRAEEFKALVLGLTSTASSSSGQTSLPPWPQTHVSNPQPIRLNSPSISHLRYRYPAVPVSNNTVNTSTAQLSNIQWSLPSAPRSLPPISIWTNTVNTSSNAQPPIPPSLPPPPSLPSIPSPLPPPSPRDQESMEASVADFMQYLENCMNETDDANQEDFSVWSPLHHLINGTSTDGEQQPENAPPPVLTSESLNLPDTPDFTIIPLECEDLPPSENIPPSVPVTLPSESLDLPNFTYDLQSEDIPSPSMNLLYDSNYQHLVWSEDIPPPVQATLPSENLSTWSNSQNGLRSNNSPPPPTFPSESLPSENIPPPVPASCPNDSYDHQLINILPPVPTAFPSESLPNWSNSQNNLPSENIPPPVPMAFPSQSLPNWSNPQNNLPLENIPPPVPASSPNDSYDQQLINILPPVPTTFPSQSLPSWSNSQNNLPTENIPPPVPASLPNDSYDQQLINIFPPVPTTFLSENLPNWPTSHNNLLPETNSPLFPATLPSGSSGMSNYPQNNIRMEDYIAELGFGTIPSWSFDWASYPSVVQRCTNIPPSSPPPATLPSGNLSG